MNWLDILIIVVLVLNGVRGLRQGLIRSVFSLAAVVGCIYGAFQGRYLFNSVFHLPGGSIPINQTLFLVLLLLLSFLVIRYFSDLVYSVIKETFIFPADLIGGLILGLARGIVILLFIVVPLIKNPLTFVVLKNGLAKSWFVQASQPLLATYSPLIEELINRGVSTVSSKREELSGSTNFQDEVKRRKTELTDKIKESSAKFVMNTIEKNLNPQK